MAEAPMNHLHYPTVRMTVVNGVLAPFLNRASPPAPFDPQLAELPLAARRQDELLAQLSHELRTPLAAIQSAMRALVNPNDAASAQRAERVFEARSRAG